MRSGDGSMQTCGLNDNGMIRAIVAGWSIRCQNVRRLLRQTTRTNLEVRMIIEFSRHEFTTFDLCKLDGIPYRYKLANKRPRVQWGN